MMVKTSNSTPNHLRFEYPINPPAKRFPVTNYSFKVSSSRSKVVDNNPDGDNRLNKMGLSLNFSSSVGSLPSSPSNSNNSSRAASPNKLNRSSTPPTPNSMEGSPSDSLYAATDKLQHTVPKKFEPYFESSQDEYLQLIEPNPVPPPSYDTLPPGGCPKFPVHAHLEPEKLPPYTPSTYKIGLISRKVEWLTPYEPSPSRSWKHVIMELNSTQLNFYHVPSAFENHVISFRPTPQSDERTYNDFEEEELKQYSSYLTQDSDLQFLKFCQRLNLIKSSTMAPSLSSNLLSVEEDIVKLNKIKNKKLLRSYSLQHARIGLATDYKKRVNVLRIRVESEQILLNFATVKDLVDWNMAINTGRDIALDISERELPRYRTVPRRRRRTTTTTRNTQSIEYNRSRSQSDPFSETSRLRGRISKLKSKFSSSLRSDSHVDFIPNENNYISSDNEEVIRSHSVPNFSLCDFEVEGNITLTSSQSQRRQKQQQVRIPRSQPQHSETITTINNDEEEDDIHNISDLHQSDDEDDEDEDDFVVDEEEIRVRDRRYTLPSSSYSSNDEFKWNPPLDKPQSQKKIYRNCLRCIKPLTTDDSWVNRILVKPTTLSPLNLFYLRNIKYCNNGYLHLISSSTTSLSSLNSSLNYKNHFNSSTSSRKKSFSFKDINGFNLPDAALTKVPNHFVKKFMVGSHGLIPTEI